MHGFILTGELINAGKAMLLCKKAMILKHTFQVRTVAWGDGPTLSPQAVRAGQEWRILSRPGCPCYVTDGQMEARSHLPTWWQSRLDPRFKRITRWKYRFLPVLMGHSTGERWTRGKKTNLQSPDFRCHQSLGVFLLLWHRFFLGYAFSGYAVHKSAPLVWWG